MADVAKKQAAPKAEKASAPKRKMLSPAERVAKIEKELADARAKLTAKADKERTSLVEKRDKLVAKRDALNTEINEANQRLEELGTGGDVPDPDPIEASTAAKIEANES